MGKKFLTLVNNKEDRSISLAIKHGQKIFGCQENIMWTLFMEWREYAFGAIRIFPSLYWKEVL